jgi:hypothetical protein
VSAAVLTPLQALVALAGIAETSLDYRHEFRRALANAHTAIVNAPLVAAPILPHAQTIELGGALETSEAEARSPGALWLPLATPAVEDVLRRAAPRECACFDGMCRCEVINGRTSTGARCRAHLADTLTADGSVR